MSNGLFSTLSNFFSFEYWLFKKLGFKKLVFLVLLTLVVAQLESFGLLSLMGVFSSTLQGAEAPGGFSSIKLLAFLPDSIAVVVEQLSVVTVALYLIFLFIFKAILTVYLSVVQTHLSNEITQKTTLELLMASECTPYRKLTRYTNGELISLTTNEVNRLTACTLGGVSSVINFFTVITLIFVSFISFPLGTLVFLFLAILFLVFFQRYNLRLKEISVSVTKLYASLYSELGSFFLNFKYLKATAKADQAIVSVNNPINQLNRVAIEQAKLIGLIQNSLEPAAAILLIVFWFFFSKNIQIDAAVFWGSAILLFRALSEVNKLSASVNRVLTSLGSFNKIQMFIKNSEPKTQKAIQKIEPTSFDRGVEIKFVNATIYADETNSKTILKNENVVFKSNSTNLIVGETGVGKSTIFDVITGLLQLDDGTIQVNGVDLISVNLLNYKKMIGYVTQEVFLDYPELYLNFPKTPKDKLVHYMKTLELGEILERELNGKIWIGDRGQSLSGGQRQRLGIIREIINQPKLLLLDEATSGLDQQTAIKTIQFIKSNLLNCTILCITHQPNLKDMFDECYQLKNSKLSRVTP